MQLKVTNCRMRTKDSANLLNLLKELYMSSKSIFSKSKIKRKPLFNSFSKKFLKTPKKEEIARITEQMREVRIAALEAEGLSRVR